MFEDKRSKRIILLAHCLLNQNSISDGTADFPSHFQAIVDWTIKNRIGILQLPCPELLCLGLDRGDKQGASRELLLENSRIRNRMGRDTALKRIKRLIRPIVFQVEEYKKYGFDIVGLVGIDRSPSCGVETTSINNKEEKGKGIFIDVLLHELVRKRIVIEAIGVKTSRVEESTAKFKQLIGNRST